MENLTEAKLFFEEQTGKPIVDELGNIEEKEIRSSVGPFRFFPKTKVVYPKEVILALAELYDEYNKAFIPSVETNNEWDTDYKYCLQGFGNGISPINFVVQIDMVGLSDGFLQRTKEISGSALRELLRKNIFEIENSLAMYQLLMDLFSGKKESYFKVNFLSLLDRKRKQFNRPIALLATTEQKYQAMKEVEFGCMNGRQVKDDEVKRLSGFDRFFGPKEFLDYLDRNNGKCGYLLYARTSMPLDKLKNPRLEVSQPLLGDASVRRIIKANTLTFNIDDPQMDSSRRINDTKEYQIGMGMAFPIKTLMDIFSLEFASHLFSRKNYADYNGNRLSAGFEGFLKKQQIEPKDVESGEVNLVFKPTKESYGCYGHVKGSISNAKVRNELKRNLRQRDGGYVVQPEMMTPSVINLTSGEEFKFIDRVFFGFFGNKIHFLGGFRALMPACSVEAKKNRNHGNGATVWEEIIT